MLILDPDTVRPQPGILLVRIDEVMGGTTKGGIFLTPDVVDAKGMKDTAYGTIVKMGPMPDLRHVERSDKPWRRPGRTEWNQTGKPWTSAPCSVGDTVWFPRDLPLVFTNPEQTLRYGLINLDEIICAMPPHNDASSLEILPSGH